MNNILLSNILVPVILAILMNGYIYSNKLYNKIVNPYIPPGYIVGIIWIIIFGLLGYVHYKLYKLNNSSTRASLFTIFVIIFSLSYPLITNLKFKSGILLDLFTLIFAFILGLLVLDESKEIFIYIIPLIVWAIYVNIADVIECSKI
jgi:tryptophan-rich sensory protein